MTGPATGPGTEPGRHSNLFVRIAAALVLVPIAIVAAFAGGWSWLALSCLTAVGLFVEWQALVGATSRPVLAGGLVALVAAGAALGLHRPGAAVLCILAGVLAVPMVADSRNRLWVSLGLIYAGAALVSSVLLRFDRNFGFEALLFVFTVVWTTDILGYFGGRGIGGPKLWVRISPKKTWAGAIAGVAGSLTLAALFAWLGQRAILPLVLLAAALSILSQLGDLFESGVKRHFNVKDSSHLIPGHGGLLDRLDGFVAVIVAAALIGAIRSGTDAAGHGLLVW